MSFEYIKNKFPIDDGFCMPAEFSKHSATVMICPKDPEVGAMRQNLPKRFLRKL